MKTIRKEGNQIVVETTNPVNKENYTYRFDQTDSGLKISAKIRGFISRTNSKMVEKWRNPGKADVPQSVKSYLNEKDYNLR